MESQELFKGSFFQIGAQQGAIYRKNGKTLGGIEIDRALYEKQLAAYKEYYPEMLDEFHGIASAGGFDEEKLAYHLMCDELRWYKNWTIPRKACTIFGVKNDNGFFVGRNYDWVPITDKFFQVYKVKPNDGNGYAAVSDMDVLGPNTKKSDLFYWVTDAINDKGLFVGLTFAYNNKVGYGLSSIHVPKLIAERCSTVGEALDTFKNIKLACPKNFFIADRHGDMAVVEHTSERFRVVYPEDGVLIKTNHYLDEELAKEDTILKVAPKHNSFKRYVEAKQKIDSLGRKFNSADITSVLGSLDSCVYQNSPEIKTIWSLALDMKKRDYKLYRDVSNGGKVIELNTR